MSDRRIAHQPIHPDLRERLDPEYVAFHEDKLQYILSSQEAAEDSSQPTEPSPFASAALKSVEVASVEDVFLKHAELRIFTPKGPQPPRGWPAFLWFHGGGWVLGDLNSDNALCSRVAERASCIAINVNYRHAPDHPYPAAVDDVFEALEWTASLESSRFSIDRTCIAIGGTSAGGNLAAVLSLKAALATPPIPLIVQLLLLPVIDNTATSTSDIWRPNRLAPWLTPARMLWYRCKYLPSREDCLGWTASPNLASRDILGESPKTWIAVSEFDLLAPEGIAYGEQLRRAGVEVDIETYKGSTHSLLAASGA